MNKATLHYNKNLEALVYKRDNLILTTRLYDCNGKLKKINEFNDDFIILELEDKKGKKYEEFVPLNEFLTELGMNKLHDKYFKGITKDNIVIM